MCISCNRNGIFYTLTRELLSWVFLAALADIDQQLFHRRIEKRFQMGPTIRDCIRLKGDTGGRGPGLG